MSMNPREQGCAKNGLGLIFDGIIRLCWEVSNYKHSYWLHIYQNLTTDLSDI